MRKLNTKYYKDFQGVLIKMKKLPFRDVYILTLKNGLKKVRNEYRKVI